MLFRSIELGRLADDVCESRNVFEHYHRNERFHGQLVNLSGNRMLIEQYRQLRANLRVAFVHARSERAAAQQQGCTLLLTEDLQHDRRIDGLRIINPFLVGPELLDAPAP